MTETHGIESRENRLEYLAQRFEAFCESHPGALLVVGTLVYLSAMIIQSSLKPLWYDEVFTHQLAGLPVRKLWEALKSGAEVHPPLSILLAHAAQKIFGSTAFASRLPSIGAFFGLALCVFVIVRKELSATWGIAAILVLFLTRAEFYATEARPYAILMGCSAFSIFCWQRMLSTRARWWPLAGIALSVATATSAHFFGLLIPFPIALGELYRTHRSRRINWPFWIAIVAGMSMIAVYIPIMRTTGRYVAHNINPVRFSIIGQLYLQPLGSLLILLPVLLTALWLHFGFVKVHEVFPFRPVTVAGFGLLLLPLFQVILGPFTNSMNSRYTESVVIGGVLLFILSVADVFGQGRAVAFSCLVMIGVATVATCMFEYRALRSGSSVPKLDVKGLPNLPIVVDQALLYMPLQYYNPELRSRICFVASPVDSIRTINSDTLDLNLLSQRGWLPLNIVDKNAMFHKGSHFLLFASKAAQAWLPSWNLEEVSKMGGEAREVRHTGTSDYYFEIVIPDE